MPNSFRFRGLFCSKAENSHESCRIFLDGKRLSSHLSRLISVRFTARSGGPVHELPILTEWTFGVVRCTIHFYSIPVKGGGTMGFYWLSCDVAPGMFPNEFAISGEEY